MVTRLLPKTPDPCRHVPVLPVPHWRPQCPRPGDDSSVTLLEISLNLPIFAVTRCIYTYIACIEVPCKYNIWVLYIYSYCPVTCTFSFSRGITRGKRWRKTVRSNKSDQLWLVEYVSEFQFMRVPCVLHCDTTSVLQNSPDLTNFQKDSAILQYPHKILTYINWTGVRARVCPANGWGSINQSANYQDSLGFA